MCESQAQEYDTEKQCEARVAKRAAVQTAEIDKNKDQIHSRVMLILCRCQ